MYLWLLIKLPLILFVCIVSLPSNAATPPLQLNTPPGFVVNVYADNIDNPRQLTRGDKGTVFVGSISAGNVYAIIPDATNQHGTRVVKIASGLNMPNGVAFYQKALFVAENDRIVRYDNIEDHLSNPPKPFTIAKLPNKHHHGWRYIRFSPDGKLYIGIGAPCNACLSQEKIFASIIRMNSNGSNMEIYAEGIRNTVGFDWDPLSHKLWFTDNGRDLMGDDIPPDELNIIDHQGEHFGFPYCHGKSITNFVFLKRPCSTFKAPALELPAHVAALGMTFYTGKQFPTDYHNQIFIAEHGSWNRSTKVGYQVTSVFRQGDHVIASKPFISGWLINETVKGRPVDVLVMPDGSLLISDDYANKIYRVTYEDNDNARHKSERYKIETLMYPSKAGRDKNLKGFYAFSRIPLSSEVSPGIFNFHRVFYCY